MKKLLSLILIILVICLIAITIKLHISYLELQNGKEIYEFEFMYLKLAKISEMAAAFAVIGYLILLTISAILHKIIISIFLTRLNIANLIGLVIAILFFAIVYQRPRHISLNEFSWIIYAHSIFSLIVYTIFLVKKDNKGFKSNDSIIDDIR